MRSIRVWRWLLPVFLFSVTPTGFADDAEIYYSQSTSADPNILFLLDTSGSMEAILPDSGGKTRMQVMQEVLGEVLSTAPPNLNVGLMRYGGHTFNSANGVSFPVKPIDSEALPIITGSISPESDNLPNPAAGTTVRQFLGNVANAWTPKGYTPIVDALYEAALYFRGGSVDFGYRLPNNVRAAHPSSYSGNITKDSCASYSNPEDCNKTWGKCTGQLVAGSCHAGWEDICTQWQQQTLSNQCCEWEATGYDESDKATGWQCVGGNSCTTIEDVCTQTGQIEVEICQHRTCQSALTGQPDYISPIQYGCQANYIVLMSDGRPEYSGVNGVNTTPKRKTQIQSLLGSTCANAPSGYKSGTCGPELAQFLAEQDQAPEVEGDQSVHTFTVAFALDDASATSYLASLATASGGVHATNSRDGLRQTLAGILRDAAAGSTLAAAAPPTYAASQPHLLALVGGHKPDPLVSAWLVWKNLMGDLSIQHSLASLFQPYRSSGIPSLAVATSGGAFTAGDIHGLTDAFTTILDKIDAAAASFSSPTYTTDRSSYLSHADEVYIPVFERSGLPLWSGNLKKFKLDLDGSVTGHKGQIYGNNNKPATDSHGVLTDDAWDFWASTASGKDVKAGGAASLLDPASRTLYTDVIGGVLSPLDKSNTAITLDLLFEDNANAGGGNNPSGCDPDNPSKGATECADYRDAVLDFIRGYNTDGSPRKHMGDIMNSRPVIVDYGDGNSYVLAGSNEGFLHAIDSQTGVEKWAFMPAPLLKNIDVFYQNNLAKTHVYGIDGGLHLWINDQNHDGIIETDGDDKVYLYFGLRRGGRMYYALDITDIEHPAILWKLDNSTSGFGELGESWSKPARAQMRVVSNPANPLESELKEVLVFGGGFDPAKEEADVRLRQPDTSGRDVFIVDALTGNLIWSLRQHVSGADGQLQDSIPGDIRVLDMDRNGALDRLYFTDTGGNVWRVDMDMDIRDEDNSLYDYTDARLTRFASLGGDGVDSRKFYYEPDVALMRHAGQTVMTIALGSGYRSHPQSDTISDRFYVLLDKSPYQPPPDPVVTLTDADLAEADTLAGSSLLDSNYPGWYYSLPNTGEKVLAPAVTFLNKVIFTTFANDGEVGDDPCQVPPNNARAYVLNLFNGQAVANLDRSEDGSKDRSVVVGVNEILDGAQIIFRAPAAVDGSACKENDCHQDVEIRVGKMAMPVMDGSNADNNNPDVSAGTDISGILPRMFWLDHDVP